MGPLLSARPQVEDFYQKRAVTRSLTDLETQNDYIDHVLGRLYPQQDRFGVGYSNQVPYRRIPSTTEDYNF